MRNILSNNKLLIVITLFFFLSINSAYYWQVWPLRWLVSFAILLLFLFLFIFFAFFFHLLNAFRERFQKGSRLALLLLMGLVLMLASYKPRGLIDFESWEGNRLLEASSKAANGCSSTIILYAKQRYSYRSVCLGYEFKRGDFRIQHDTIWFLDPIPHGKLTAYEFALIPAAPKAGDPLPRSLALFTGKNDSLPQILGISKNELPR